MRSNNHHGPPPRRVLAGLATVFVVISSSGSVPALPAIPGSNFFVSVDGTALGDGSESNPWDLQTAFDHPRQIQPGDTIWLDGGTYFGDYESRLTGTAEKPVTVRPSPGEWIRIDSNDADPVPKALDIVGDYAHYWDFEVMSSHPDRVTNQPGSWPTDIPRGSIEIRGDHNKVINFIVHDLQKGFGFWSSARGGEIYGTIIYNNGWDAPDRPHGHGIYTQNALDPKIIEDSMNFGNFRQGLNVYGSSAATLSDYQMEGNTFFSNGGFNALIGGGAPAQNIAFSNTYNYDGQILLGLSETPLSSGFEMTDSYIEGVVTLWAGWNDLTFTNNTVVNAEERNDFKLVRVQRGVDPSAFNWNNNSYQSSSGVPFANQSSSKTWTQWRAGTGLDDSSTYDATDPTGTHVFVRPNKYETGRAHVTIYNWDELSSVGVDLSEVIDVGDNYIIHSVYDLFGDPLVEGIYNGGSVHVPMDQVTSIPAPIGGGKDPIEIGVEFGAFLLRAEPTAFVRQPGDANEDREFNSGDIVQVLGAGRYETGEPATWAQGDWDGALNGALTTGPPPGDGFFNSTDIVAALAANLYEKGPYAAISDGVAETNNVPELSTLALTALSFIALLAFGRRRSVVGSLAPPGPKCKTQVKDAWLATRNCFYFIRPFKPR